MHPGQCSLFLGRDAMPRTAAHSKFPSQPRVWHVCVRACASARARVCVCVCVRACVCGSTLRPARLIVWVLDARGQPDALVIGVALEGAPGAAARGAFAARVLNLRRQRTFIGRRKFLARLCVYVCVCVLMPMCVHVPTGVHSAYGCFSAWARHAGRCVAHVRVKSKCRALSHHPRSHPHNRQCPPHTPPARG
jgi:hypothetical protein